MLAFDPSGRYGAAAVLAELQGVTGGRIIDFRYDLLDLNNRLKGPMNGVTDATISQDASADVQRTASFTILDGFDGINYISDRIKPYFRLRMPVDGGWVEWPLGVFLLSSPTRSLMTDGSVIRSVEAYDQMVILSGDAVSDRYSIPAGTLFVSAIQALISSDGFVTNITPSGLTLPVEWDYAAGTAKLTILNDLLSAMNYRSAWFDENGILVCQPYVLPDNRAVGYTYATDSTSLYVGEIDQTLDLFNVPNKWTLVVSDTDQASFSSTFTNTDPNSPTSTVSRGRTILSFLDGQTAADQATLDALTQKQAHDDSQIYETIGFTTALMPFHSNADILGIVVGGLGLGSVKFEELTFSLELKPGATMSHTVRRSISTTGGA